MTVVSVEPFLFLRAETVLICVTWQLFIHSWPFVQSTQSTHHSCHTLLPLTTNIFPVNLGHSPQFSSGTRPAWGRLPTSASSPPPLYSLLLPPLPPLFPHIPPLMRVYLTVPTAIPPHSLQASPLTPFLLTHSRHLTY